MDTGAKFIYNKVYLCSYLFFRTDDRTIIKRDFLNYIIINTNGNNNSDSKSLQAENNQNSRRAFIKTSAQITALAAAGPLVALSPLSTLTARQPLDKMMNGIQIGAVSFVDEGVEQVLDIMQKRGAINTLFLTTFTHGRGLAGRQIPGQPFLTMVPKSRMKKPFMEATLLFLTQSIIKIQC